MSIRIDETFTIAAPIDRVFEFVTDPRQVVHCITGAELTGETDSTTFAGRIKVKVGPVVAAYAGQVHLVSVDAAAHRVQLVADGRESGGAGSAKMSMTSSMQARDTAQTEVHVVAELDVAGKIVSFGRGMIESVNRQLVRQFIECLRGRLEAPRGVPEPVASAGAQTVPIAPAPASAPASSVPVRLVPLVLRAIRDWIAHLCRRGAGADRP
jgi:carbon monoxide dehydrogenase subunit G